MEDADFSGYATKAGIKCSDGRTITPDAFKHQDKLKVPLVWQHGHGTANNVLGHAWLEARDSSHPDGAGIYTYGYFNDTEAGKNSKSLVQHGDVVSLSIYANGLAEKVRGGLKEVIHGTIREVSLVLSGANPGALIDNVKLEHSDGGIQELEDEAIIYSGLELSHADGDDEKDDNVDENGETIQEVYDTLTPKQKDVVSIIVGAAMKQSESDIEALSHDDPDHVQGVYATMTDKQKHLVSVIAGAALEQADEEEGTVVEQEEVTPEEPVTEEADATEETPEETPEDSDTKVEHTDMNNDEGNLAHQEGNNMPRNAFDQNGSTTVDNSHALSHDAFAAMVETTRKEKGNLRDAFLAHAEEYGITDINLLFPDARALTQTPEFIQRRNEWVSVVLGGTKHSPFAKVKTLLADITEPEARAKGYIKGTRKKEEVFNLLRRTTGPATIYKKQKLDRDDILDITDIDVVNWLKAEMRVMIEEEIARAILVGDGRSTMDEDKVKDPAGAVDGTGIRSILNDDDLYSIKYPLAANVSPKDAVKGLVRARSGYRGTGKPTLFISDAYLTDIMLEEDKFGRPLYETEQSLADKLRVSKIVTVDLFDDTPELFAIMVSLVDYTIGSNRGGELTNFEDFDIDFNQQKYLQETRLSGGLTRPFSAVVVTRAQGTLAEPEAPSFDGTTDTITIPTVTGVSYFDTSDDSELTGDVVITQATEVEARPDEGYYFAPNTNTTWTYTP